MNVKSITSYVQDWQGYYSSAGSEDPTTASATLEDPDPPVLPAVPPGRAHERADGRLHRRPSSGKNERYGLSQEIRFSSAADARPFSWVGGIYYANSRTHILYRYPGNGDRIALAFWGITADTRYGLDPATGRSFNVDGGSQACARTPRSTTTRLAAFGDANYWLTEKLKAHRPASACRACRSTTSSSPGASSTSAGPTAPAIDHHGVAKRFAGDAEDRRCSTSSPRTTWPMSRPSKGFRAGGVNSAGLRGLLRGGPGTRPASAPTRSRSSYGPDTVWSYEAAANSACSTTGCS